MTELVVVRHGETDWNVEGRIQGQHESELNERGRAQVAALGRRFQGERVDAIYSSDLKRTMDTARPIAAAAGLPIHTDQRLREWDLGCLVTMLQPEARERAPEAMRIYDERIVDAVVPEGESIRQRYARATTCIEAIADTHAEQRVVVVTHGGILDDLYRFVNGIALDAERTWDLYNAGVNLLRTEATLSVAAQTPGRWWIERWGDVDHLAGIGSMAQWGNASRS